MNLVSIPVPGTRIKQLYYNVSTLRWEQCLTDVLKDGHNN